MGVRLAPLTGYGTRRVPTTLIRSDSQFRRMGLRLSPLTGYGTRRVPTILISELLRSLMIASADWRRQFEFVPCTDGPTQRVFQINNGTGLSSRFEAQHPPERHQGRSQAGAWERGSFVMVHRE
jgi:hypothetical protein